MNGNQDNLFKAEDQTLCKEQVLCEKVLSIW